MVENRSGSQIRNASGSGGVTAPIEGAGAISSVLIRVQHRWRSAAKWLARVVATAGVPIEDDRKTAVTRYAFDRGLSLRIFLQRLTPGLE
jgi:hypothetical protein